MKNKKWVRRRHQIIQNLALPGFKLVLACKFKFKYDKIRVKRKQPYIVIHNHQTLYDQFLVGLSVRGPIYYVATEDITSAGFVSKLLYFGVNVIPFKKSTSDINAVRSCLRVIKEGGTIIIAPEGNRTYSGETGNIKPSIVKLIKKMKVPLILYNIKGGYGVLPRWAEKPRYGTIEGRITRIMQYDEYKDLSNEEFFDIVKNALYVNDNDVIGTYKSKKNAECLERAIYVCPKCGISEFESEGNNFRCKHCGLEAVYESNKKFKDEIPFKNVLEWYQYQEDYINNLELSQFENNCIFENDAKLLQVIPYKKKQILMKECVVKSFNDHIEVINKLNNDDFISLKYDELSAMSVLGKNKFNFYCGGNIYQIKSDIHFNALKYVNIYYHYVNTNNLKTEEDFDESRKFLGL